MILNMKFSREILNDAYLKYVVLCEIHILNDVDTSTEIYG
jgi:hypothetical protein